MNFRVFPLPEPIEKLGISGREVVGANRGFLQVSDYVIDHVADTKLFLGRENVEGPGLGLSDCDSIGVKWGRGKLTL